MNRIVIFITFLVCLFSPCVSSAFQSTLIRFKSIGVDEGLSNKTVRDIIQDKQGYIWIATEQGLTKFDGIELKNYQKSSSNHLSGNYITSLALDDFGNVWAGTGSHGLNRYSNKKDIFEPFNTKNSNLMNNGIRSLFTDRDNVLWIGTNKGLSKLDLKAFNRGQIKFSEPIFENLDIRAITQGRDGNLWLGLSNGLIKYTPEKHTFENINFPTKNQPLVRAIKIDHNQTIWLGTSNGLYYYDNVTNSIEKHNQFITTQFVVSLLVDRVGNLWVGTTNEGVYVLYSNGKHSHYVKDKGDSYSLGDNAGMALYQDHSGVIWIGTYDAGIHWFEPSYTTLGANDNSLNSISCLPTNLTFSTVRLSEDELIMGTDKGIQLINFESKQCEDFIKFKTDKNILSNIQVFALHLDKYTLWIGASNGVFKYDTRTNTITEFDSVLKEISVYSFTKGINDNLILGTSSGLFNIRGGKLKKLNSGSVKNAKMIYEVTKGKSGDFWIGSSNGLLHLSSDSSHLKTEYKILGVDFPTHIRSVLPLSEDTLLITIDDRGLFEYKVSTKTLKSVANKYNIPITSGFAGLLTDLQGYVWLMTTNKGLYHFAIDKLGSTHYEYQNGLVSNYVTPGSARLFKNGELFFGSHSGFSIINPPNIKQNKVTPKVAITKFTTDGKANQIGTLSEQNSISVNHSTESVEIEFKVFHYSDPAKNKFKYKLDGWSQKWIQSSSMNNRVIYENLPSGIYLFQVKASNPNNIWSDVEEIEFVITTAPWLTWWAYTIYAISSIFLILLFFNKRTQWLKKRASELEKIVTNRTKELADEKEKVEQLLTHKNEEFANVSHEFRTPLTLIIGPLTQLIESKQNNNNYNRLNIIQRNSYRLLRMVDQLLNLETFRVKAITQRSPQAISKIIILVGEAFVDLAKQKNIKLVIKKIEPINFEFTSDGIEKIILNLLSNAIKYSKNNSQITLGATRTIKNEYIIKVTDTGIGISPDKLNDIFERYNRILDKHSEQITGAGIGLALVKSLVESHNGQITVKSELGKGSCFEVILPIVNEVKDVEKSPDKNQEIIDIELMSLTQQVSNYIEKEPKNLTIDSNRKPILLIIEDNQDMRHFICDNLKNDYQLITAKNGVEGVARAIENVPNVIISDIMMPKLDGYQTTRRLRENDITNHIPIILLTARGDRVSRLKGWKENADEYITKPFDVEELKIRIKNLLSIRKILKRRFGEKVFDSNIVDHKAIDNDLKNRNLNQVQQEFILKLNNALEKIYQSSSLSVSDIADKVYMSERQFFRKLKNVVDMTPSEYIRRYRLEKSKALLSNGKSANYTASEIGFSSQGYFSTCFKAQFGITPLEFKNRVEK